MTRRFAAQSFQNKEARWTEIMTIPMREGVTMGKAVRRLSEKYGRSGSVPNFSKKLKRGFLKCRVAKELADAPGYGIAWKKRGENCG